MSTPADIRMPAQRFLAFPFRISAAGGAQSARLDHIREQVEQVLYTSAGERVFRPEFGFGARAFVFEPNRAQIWEIARNRLMSALAEVLAGEIDPKTLRVEVAAHPDSGERLMVRIEYVVAALHKEESHLFAL
ncbi:MAG: GPW/gp25 family protein [Paracoccaceae bacterium]|nr:GPW/gp25 family protein [Paracoccaceae bacterium]